MNKLAILGFLVASTMAVPMPTDLNSLQPNRDLDCFEQENTLFSCIFVKTVSSLNRAARSNDIEIIDGIKFVRDTPMERNGKDLQTELDIMNELPRDTSDRAVKLVSMLYESAMSFVKSHSLKLSMPEEGSISRALGEGRGKIKKMVLPVVAAVALKLFALVPILLGGLGLLVLKALFVGKIALLLAGVLGFQRLFGGSGNTSFFSKNSQPTLGWPDNANPAWSAGSVAGVPQQGYYKRSFDIENAKMDAQSMAYAAHVPVTNEDSWRPYLSSLASLKGPPDSPSTARLIFIYHVNYLVTFCINKLFPMKLYPAMSNSNLIQTYCITISYITVNYTIISLY
ncbi:DUF1676 domain-containing protein Osi14 [Ptiloglossa arizonensis]|uniref:DUF1676 domain-containing protein Osi14 n=1 Tax=Ptiloglossa arizonensis TaxID=3350558 RepID=UPI003FA12721